MRIVVLMPNWIGDAVMATAALANLRRHEPGSFVVGVMKPIIAELLAGTSFFDEVVAYDPRSTVTAQRFWPAVGRVRSFRPDMTICLRNSIRAALFCWLTAAKRRVGWSGGIRRWIFSSAESPIQRGSRQAPVSALDYYLSVMRAAGIPASDRQMFLATRAKDEVTADESMRRLGLHPPRPLLVLNSGGAYGPAKNWPVDYFAELARRWAVAFDSHVLVLCGPAERHDALAIETKANHPRVRSLAHFEPDLGRTKAIIRRARLMVSTDSGPRHIAAAFGVPVVALFGPTDPRWSENYNPRELQLRLHFDCQPCARRLCPLRHHRCMKDLTIEQVWPAAVQLWTTSHVAIRAS